MDPLIVHDMAKVGFKVGTNELYDRLVRVLERVPMAVGYTHDQLPEHVRRTLPRLWISFGTKSPGLGHSML